MNLLKHVSIILMATLSSIALADLDPELAGTQNNNQSGFFVGGGLSVGQATDTHADKAGSGWLLNAEPGMVVRRGSWGRIEASLRLSYGEFESTRALSDSVDVDYKLPVQLLMMRVGSGWSLGDSLYNAVKFGVGMGQISGEGTAAGVDVSLEDGSGLAVSLDYEAIMALTNHFELVGGFGLTHFWGSFDKFKTATETISLSGSDGDFRVNYVNASVGFRVKL